MSKPFSVRTEPWTSFDKQSYNIFTDDFVHEKLFTTKAAVKSVKGGGVNLKQQVTRKGDNFKVGGEIKLWFPLWNDRAGQLYFKSKGEDFKVHYDNGLTTVENSKLNFYNLYGSYQSNKNFKNIVLKTGVNLLTKHCSFDNRVRVQCSEDCKNYGISTGHKFTWAKGNWSFDAYEIIGWKHVTCISNAIRIGFRQGDNDFFLRANNQTERSITKADYTKPQTYFSKFILDYVRKIDDVTKIGLEAELTPNSFEKSSFVFQRSIPNRNRGVKAKISTDKSAALCYQSVIQKYGKWTVGVQVSEISTKNNIKYGLQLDLNI